MAEMKKILTACVLAAGCLTSAATARSLTVAEDSVSIQSGLPGATKKPCFRELYASRKSRKLAQPIAHDCTVCIYPEDQPHISDLYSLSRAIHSAQAFTCGNKPGGVSNADTIEAAKALVKTTAEAFTINACQVLSGSATVCVADPSVPTVVHQVVKAFVETDSYYGFTQGWSVALPCEDQCDVHTDMAMDSVKGILEAAATEAYTFLCQGTSGTWTVPELSQRIEGVALEPLAEALAKAVVPAPDGRCLAVVPTA